jgi:hypothetical protein
LDELDGEVNPSDNIKGPCTLQLDTVLERLSRLQDPHNQLSLNFWSETHCFLVAYSRPLSNIPNTSHRTRLNSARLKGACTTPSEPDTGTEVSFGVNNLWSNSSFLSLSCPARIYKSESRSKLSAQLFAPCNIRLYPCSWHLQKILSSPEVIWRL